MLGLERRDKIMERLRLDKKVYVNDLAEEFKVTKETIRRDLELLENDGRLRRNYGGAVLPEAHTSEDISFVKRSQQNLEAKLAIAEKALPLINDGDTLMVDASTTCYTFLRQLSDRRLTIITNSIRIMEDFNSTDFELICTGGNLRKNSRALTGSVAYASIEKYYVDHALLSCKALSRTKGIMESNADESTIKELMMQQAKSTILLADSTKFDATAFVKFADITSAATIVTDKPCSRDWQDFLREKNVKIID